MTSAVTQGQYIPYQHVKYALGAIYTASRLCQAYHATPNAGHWLDQTQVDSVLLHIQEYYSASRERVE